jgi:hypothetical protein
VLNDQGSISRRGREEILSSLPDQYEVQSSPIQCVTGALSSGGGGIKRSGREADNSPPSSSEVNDWSYTSTPSHIFMAWYIVRHRDNFNFTFYLRVQNGSGAHQASYPNGTRGSFPGSKAAGV